MRIDAHQHFWEYSPSEYDWIDERMHVLKKDFGPADLKPHLDATGIGGSVAVQARQSVEETEYLLRLADTTDSVLGVVGWVDLCSEDALAQLEQFGAHERFVGARHIVQDEPDDYFLLREDFLRGVALLKEHDLTYDVLIYPSQLPAALEFGRAVSRSSPRARPYREASYRTARARALGRACRETRPAPKPLLQSLRDGHRDRMAWVEA